MKLNFKISKHTYLLSVLLCLFFLNIKAQTNLVPNPSFEQYTNCPSNVTLNEALNSKPDIWYKPDTRGAGYYNACATIGQLNVPYSGFGFQYARTGVGIVAMYYRNGLESKTYFQVQLFDSLRSGKYYYAEYYVSLCNTMKLGCNNIGMLFTDTVRYADTSNGKCVMLANPQIVNYGNSIITDTLNWVKVSGIFKAKGGEQYLTLGNFKSNANTAYTIIQPTGYFGAGYYADDVAVYNLDSFCLQADAGRDTTINAGDSVFIGSSTNGIDSLKWQVQGNTIDSTRPGFWVHPTVTTNYILQQVVNSCFSSDTVKVTVGTVPLKFISYSVISRNEKSVENLWITANEINVSHFYVQRSTNGKDFTAIHKEQAKNQTLNNYSFIDNETRNEKQETLFYRIVSVDRDGKTSFSEVRNIEYRTGNNELLIYPNPAKDFVTVTCKEMKEVSIVDYLGRTVYQQILRQAQNDAVTINCKQLNKGLYVVKIVMKNGEVKTQKLIVE